MRLVIIFSLLCVFGFADAKSILENKVNLSPDIAEEFGFQFKTFACAKSSTWVELIVPLEHHGAAPTTSFLSYANEEDLLIGVHLPEIKEFDEGKFSISVGCIKPSLFSQIEISVTYNNGKYNSHKFIFTDLGKYIEQKDS